MCLFQKLVLTHPQPAESPKPPLSEKLTQLEAHWRTFSLQFQVFKVLANILCVTAPHCLSDVQLYISKGSPGVCGCVCVWVWGGGGGGEGGNVGVVE